MTGANTMAPGLKPKDLVGIPWRVAFALQADGWYLRSDIIWSKPNPMPESVTDRPTKAHEYVFLLSKRERYYFDADAVRETQAEATAERYAAGFKDRYADVADAKGYRGPAGGQDGYKLNPAGRNIRSVWNIATQPYPGAHFATFPEALVVPCIKAGTSERGVCSECGAPWERVVERGEPAQGRRDYPSTSNGKPEGIYPQQGGYLKPRTSETTGWRPTCDHYDPELRSRGNETDSGSVNGASFATSVIPATVLDPFSGSGTVGRVAERLSRRAILIELNPAYVELAEERTAQVGLGLTA